MKVDIKKFQGDIYQIDVMMEGKTSRMACYYIDSRDPILVEVGPSNSFPYLIAGLDSLGISNIKRTAITHLHLDHVGGIGHVSEKYKDTLVICAFPANNFLWQEPLSNEGIKKFCNNNYGVTFSVFEKISVKGNNKHPIYKWLSNKALNGQINKEPNWNFCKYIVDSEGKLLYFFGPRVEPLSSQITNIFD